MDFDAVLIAPRRAAMIRAGYWRDKTVNDHFDAVLATRPDALAVSSISAADGGRRDFTWAELDRLASRAAVGLTRLGVGCAMVGPGFWSFRRCFAVSTTRRWPRECGRSFPTSAMSS